MSKPGSEKLFREKMIVLLQQLHKWGLSELIFNHVTVRIPDTDWLLINPQGMMFAQVKESDLVCIDLKGAVRETPKQLRAPAPSRMHCLLHQQDPEIECIIHHHSEDSIVASLSDHGLRPFNQYVEFVKPILSIDFPKNPDDFYSDLQSRRQKERTLLLKNHGAVCLGKSCEEALLRCYMLERACRIQNRAQSLSGNLSELPPGVKLSLNPLEDDKTLQDFWKSLVS